MLRVLILDQHSEFPLGRFQIFVFPLNSASFRPAYNPIPNHELRLLWCQFSPGSQNSKTSVTHTSIPPHPLPVSSSYGPALGIFFLLPLPQNEELKSSPGVWQEPCMSPVPLLKWDEPLTAHCAEKSHGLPTQGAEAPPTQMGRPR